MNSRRDRGVDSTQVAELADALTIAGPMTADATVVGDAPTRLHLVSTWLNESEANGGHTAGAPCTASRRASAPARRVVVLSAALVASFALGVGAGSMGARRAEARGSGPPTCASAVKPLVSPPATDPSDGPTQLRAKPEPEVFVAKPAGLDANRGLPPDTAGAQTKAHVAADAFATGNYAQALAVYEELAAEQSTNRAYVQAANVLRTWLAPAARGMRQPLPMKEPP